MISKFTRGPSSHFRRQRYGIFTGSQCIIHSLNFPNCSVLEVQHIRSLIAPSKRVEGSICRNLGIGRSGTSKALDRLLETVNGKDNLLLLDGEVSI